ncbi:hypothetical protein LMG3441_00391 [Achromobacter kerstersii]|jgi:hypothetical protein|uniref:Uncharacterized protein n=1 Tax=Achromobacter kerstersii TaxID=1353890 RepID=A0A6S6Z1Q4_9BURK|nr:hypothetical protein LMG3441_00391 [Achromobacter kerstersii]
MESFVSHTSTNHQSIQRTNKASVQLEGWGMPADEVIALAATLNRQVPALDWFAEERADREALTLHLVDIAALAGESGHAVWNTFGPVEAMRQAREAGQPALAVCRGKFSELPVDRLGVWVAAAGFAWETKTQAVIRALAAMAWQPQRGYQDLPGWQAVQPLTQRNLLAITASDDDKVDFPALMRQVSEASFMHPAALSVAGVPTATFERTLVEAGMQDLHETAVAPMTLDGVLRIDALVGFPWQGTNQSAAV